MLKVLAYAHWGLAVRRQMPSHQPESPPLCLGVGLWCRGAPAGVWPPWMCGWDRALRAWRSRAGGMGIGITAMLAEEQSWLQRLPAACPSPPASPGAASPLPAALLQWFLGSCFQTVHQLIFRWVNSLPARWTEWNDFLKIKYISRFPLLKFPSADLWPPDWTWKKHALLQDSS